MRAFKLKLKNMLSLKLTQFDDNSYTAVWTIIV